MKGRCEEDYDAAIECQRMQDGVDFWLRAFYIFWTVVGVGLIVVGFAKFR